MTKEEIIEMVKQVGGGMLHDGEFALMGNEKIKAFAKLVAEKEREKFCAVLRQLHDSYSLTSDSNAIRARGQE